MIKFAHMSDCHLGSWSSHPEMRDMPLVAFETAIDKCISEGVDFIIIAGDLLDTSLPGIDVLRRAASKFRQCREAEIPVYMVAGSHDYSPTGKTMLSVFENAGLITDVAKCETNGEKMKLLFTVDEKTGVKITGIFGRKGSLEIESFNNIDRSIEDEDGFKIFVFHCGIDEHTSMTGMSAVPVSLLPKNFNYYATGHIHLKRVYTTPKGKVAFPGPLFPTSFDELEVYDSSFYIITADEKTMDIRQEKVKLFNTVLIDRDVAGRTPGEIENILADEIDGHDVQNAVVLIKLRGTLKSGKVSDVDFKSIAAKAESLGALAVKKNISRLVSESMQDSEVEDVTNIDELEKKIVAENAPKMQLSGQDSEKIIFSLIDCMKEEKGEDETNAAFEEKIRENGKRLLGL